MHEFQYLHRGQVLTGYGHAISMRVARYPYFCLYMHSLFSFAPAEAGAVVAVRGAGLSRLKSHYNEPFADSKIFACQRVND
jgi:hypothetical protein